MDNSGINEVFIIEKGLFIYFCKLPLNYSVIIKFNLSFYVHERNGILPII